MHVPPDSIVFGPFRLAPSRRTLERDGAPVALSARAFDMLAALIEARDRVVGREEIIALVWPGITVEPSNLTVQMSTLRRALGDVGPQPTWIATIPGRGYRFIGAVAGDETATLDAGEPGEGVASDVVAFDGARELTQAQPRTLLVDARRMSGRRAGWVTALAACVLVAAVMGVFGSIWWQRAPNSARPRLSIAVLPFRNLSGELVRDDMADAITDDLTTDLSHLAGSLVIARASADSYKGKQVPANQIGRELNVRYVLEGSIRAVQGKIRVNAQLIDATNGSHLWAEHYDADLGHPWDAQDDIVHHIDSALGLVLVHDVVTRAPRERPGQPDALDMYYHARSILDHGDSLEGMTQAQTLLERVRAMSPDYTDGLIALGWLLARKLQTYDYPGYVQDAEEADRVTTRALALAPSSPAALASRARFLIYEGHFAQAEPGLDAALAIEANNLQALQDRAICAWLTGQPEKAIAPEQQVLRLDPAGPSAVGRYQLLGLASLFAGHPNEAAVFLHQAEGGMQSTPGAVDQMTPFETTQLYLIAATMMSGDPTEAKRRYRAFSSTWPRRTIWREMAYFTAEQARLPYFAKVGDALRAAGMPRFADEHEDEHVPPTATPLAGSDFTPTPTHVPGATTIDTAGLVHLLGSNPATIVVDVGRLCAAPLHAIPLSDAEGAGSGEALKKTAFGTTASRTPDAPIVVVGTGSSGVNSYNTSLHLLAVGYRNLYWYRGGEEAWASAGLPTLDRR